MVRGAVVGFTFELDCLSVWQRDHPREGLDLERPRFPAIDAVAAVLA